ncbi:unnamed protein product [Caenorhabditis nigoni]
MNVIFKSWMEMKSFQNLKSFEINLSNRGDFVEVALKDISYKKRSSITGRYSSYIREGPFEVTRKDGRMAMIAVCEYPSEFFVAMCPQPPV